jgi:hypothetical protein
MDYKEAWEHLKEWIEQALDEGKQRGFAKDFYLTQSKEVGMYHAYELVYIEIKRKENQK